MRILWITFCLILFFGSLANAQFFDVTAISDSLIDVEQGDVAWGDYDNDGDLDILLTGDTGSEYVTKIYVNESMVSFSEDLMVTINGVYGSSVDWGDYDNDDDLDILLIGYANGGRVSRIYRNDGGSSFIDIGAGLTEIWDGDAKWGDYDNDGDLDVLLVGSSQIDRIGRIYENTDSGFVQGPDLPDGDAFDASVDWGDYDNDGDLDILFTGNVNSTKVSRVYENQDGAFVIAYNLPDGVSRSSVDWGDFDNDGDLDILLAGLSGIGNQVTKIYRNTGAGFDTTSYTFDGVEYGSVAWGDYDNDGDLDVLLTGSVGISRRSKVYQNQGDNFVEVFSATGVSESKAVWGDYDLDGDLDFLLCGSTGTVTRVTRLYENDADSLNMMPIAPDTLWSTVDGYSVTLNWNAGTDTETPSSALTYNLRMGNSPGGIDLISPMTDPSGWRRIVDFGAQGHNLTWTIDSLPVGTYFWSVQSIDHGFLSSSFDYEDSFEITGGAAGGFSEQFGGVLTGVYQGNATWGDFEGDGDLDILLTGFTGVDRTTEIYENLADSTGSVGFSEIYSGDLISVGWSNCLWVDYDRDGDLDAMVMGEGVGAGNTKVTKLYENTGSGFNEDTSVNLVGVDDGCAAWGDYDHDGDLDLLLVGLSNTGRVSKIYENMDGNFNEIFNGLLPGVSSGTVDWVDYNNDGDLDICLTGDLNGFDVTTRLYQNTGGTFVEDSTANLLPVSAGDVDWGDMDGDGDLDVIITGFGGGKAGAIYQNEGTGFSEVYAGEITPVFQSSVEWGDYDNDGDLDILLIGESDSGKVTQVYQNTGVGFIEVFNGTFVPLMYGSCEWGDYDNDGDLDILLSGDAGSANPTTRIYRNDGGVFNAPPMEPVSLNGAVAGNNVVLSWDIGGDAETPNLALTYNLRVGSMSGGGGYDIISPMALSNGKRQVAAMGGQNQNLSWDLRNLENGTYYWSVQTIDHAFAGSEFPTDHFFEITESGDSTNSFVDIDAALDGVKQGAVDWGDYNNDGELDLILTGESGVGTATRLYTNDGMGGFTDSGISFIGAYASSVKWGDYDNDGNLDVLLAGKDDTEAPFTMIYRNEGGGTFADIGADLTGLYSIYSSDNMAWGDYDHDGSLDFVITGRDSADTPISLIYRNNNDDTFTEMGGLVGVSDGSVAWGDYDLDGDLDLLLTGFDGSAYTAKIYENSDGTFIDSGIGLTNVSRCSGSWGDYDLDGDLDVLLTGVTTGDHYVSKVYRNDAGNIFNEEINANLVGVVEGNAAWGDYDSDGDLDIVLAGKDSLNANVSLVYRNNGGGNFEDIGAGLTGVKQGDVAWGDYDRDGDLDIVLIGYDGANRIAILYRNDGTTFNTPPSQPGNLSVFQDGDRVTFNWDPATDNETPNGLTYALRIGSTPGDIDILSPMSFVNEQEDRRKLATMGLTPHTSWSLDRTLPAAIYYWSVQAIDNNFAGSYFAAEESFEITGGDVDSLFTEQESIALTSVHYSSLDWGDYDNDSDLDLALWGWTGAEKIGKVYQNNGTNFTEGYSLPGMSHGSVNWGDFDNDADLDLLVNGHELDGTRYTRIYENEGGSFNEIYTGQLIGVDDGIARWGDFDNDGDLDIALTGNSGLEGYVSRIYENTGDGFTEVFLETLVGLGHSALAWGDYDNDGDLDLFLMGEDSGGQPDAKLYYNDSGDGFVEDTGATFVEVRSGSASWGDYDMDGDLDLLITGEDYTATAITRLYQNQYPTIGFNPVFVDTLPNMVFGNGVWGDYDNDGDLDILFTGLFEGNPTTRIYENQGTTFIQIDFDGFPGIYEGMAVWGDYDTDGDLDIALTGYDGMGVVSEIYRNESGVMNTPPDPPTTISSVVTNGEVSLNWSAGSDFETLDTGLNYNIRVGTYPGGDDYLFPMAQGNGWRQVVEMGGQNQNLSWTLKDLPMGLYFWSVQTIDNNFAGSAFAVEDSFEITTPAAGSFSEQFIGSLSGVDDADAAWGDFDNDGDLDLVLAGMEGAARVTKLYRNDVTDFVEVYPGSLTGVSHAALAWGDYDNDDDLDLLLTGNTNSGSTSKIYENTGSGFTEVFPGALSSIEDGDVDWGDFDNDGLLDILLTGSYVTYIYKNIGNGFIDAFPNREAFPQVTQGGVEWGDYDNDGDLDFVITGASAPNPISKVYENIDGYFSETYVGSFVGLMRSDVACGNFDNDGDLDLVFIGEDSTYTKQVYLYENTGTDFITIFTGEIPSTSRGSVDWGDYDNDGDLDLLFTGEAADGILTTIFANTDSGFVDATPTLFDPISDGCGRWGDYNDDGRLDVLVVGNDFSKIYRNDGDLSNNPPSPPSNLVSTVDGNTAQLSWESGNDIETITPTLTYNLRVGTYPEGDDILGPMSDWGGWRKLPDYGSQFHNISWFLKDLEPGWYYWGVQTVDTGLMGSAFAVSDSFEIAGSDGEFTLMTDIVLEGCADGDVEWGDFDNDNDLDLLFIGEDNNYSPITKLYENDNNDFVEVYSGTLRGITDGSADWGDFDNDGDLDLLLTGQDDSYYQATIVYENTGAGFNEVYSGIIMDVGGGDAIWVDMDNDGDLDILLTGLGGVSYTSTTKLYENTGTGFVEWFGSNLENINDSQVAAGDYDNDGDLDLLISGATPSSGDTTLLYENTNEGFSLVVDTGLPDFSGGDAAWGDIDNDGDLDLVLVGYGDYAPAAKIYANEGNGSFNEIHTGILTGVAYACVDLGDYNNDGWLDIILSGEDNDTFERTKVYTNTGSGFEELDSSLTPVTNGDAEWGDYDNDGDLDLVVMGIDESYTYIAEVYRNDFDMTMTPNNPPNAPTGLSYYSDQNQIFLSWQPSSDLETADSSLTYNLQIGSEPGAGDVLDPMSDMYGWRKVAQMGGQNLSTSWLVQGLPIGTYYWKVQAVDTGYMGSEFSAESSFVVSEEPSLPAFSLMEEYADSLMGVSSSHAAWGDFDNDYDLDLFLMGYDDNYQNFSQLYQNTGTHFEPVLRGLFSPASDGAAEWLDLDRDGDLDLVIVGLDSSDSRIGQIYENQGTTFVEIFAGDLVPVQFSSIDGGDYDNDGDLDLIITGFNGTYPITKLYENTGSGFTSVLIGVFTDVSYGDAIFGDYDNDGDLDIFLMGADSGYQQHSQLYENIGGYFTEVFAGTFIPLSDGGATWGDYDQDGDLDLAITGNDTDYLPVTKVYQNIGGGFTEAYDLSGLKYGNPAWGDYDNDGDLDLLVMGEDSDYQKVTQLYENTGANFNPIHNFMGASHGMVNWVDFDNDADLDILLTGETVSGSGVTLLYQNNVDTMNTAPQAPTGLYHQISDSGGVTLGWSMAGDNQTEPTSLTYNIRLGTVNGVGDVVSPMAFGDGWRKIVDNGNHALEWTYRLPEGMYFWSVQAIDNGFMGSEFAIEDTFTVTVSGGDPYEPNDSLSIATPIAIYDTLEAEINPAGDVDWYQFYGMAGDSVLMYTELLAGSDLDARFHLYYESQDSLVIDDDDSHGEYQPEINIVLPQTGNYYLRVAYYNNEPLFRSTQEKRRIGSLRSNDVGGYRLVLSPPEPSSVFTEVISVFPAVQNCALAWGDYNRDGYLDLALMGAPDDSTQPICQVYDNEMGSFSLAYDLYGLAHGAVKWIDHDNDNDLDLFVLGYDESMLPTTMLYENFEGEFVESVVQVIDVARGDAGWGDYDNDGDFDLLITGLDYLGDPVAMIYENTPQGFVADSIASASLVPVYDSDVAWGDFNNDMRLDVVITGDTGGGVSTNVYQNLGGTFAEYGVGTLTGVKNGSVAWGDFNNTLGLDLLLTGRTNDGRQITHVYDNTGVGFSESFEGTLVGVEKGSAVWGDYDQDGDLDFLLTGWNGVEAVTMIYENTIEQFVPLSIDLIGLQNSCAAWGNYDADGGLDFVIAGETNGQGLATTLYHNEIEAPFSFFQPPSNLNAINMGNGEVSLSWTPFNGGDEWGRSSTPSNALTYNLRVGTSSEVSDIVSPMCIEHGPRLLHQMGSQQQNLGWILTNLPEGTYYWSVQAVDHTFQSSPFAQEQVFTVSASSGDPYEPNDSLDVATVIDIYDTLEAEIDPVDDVDWYQFYGETGQSILIYTEQINGSDLDPEFYLYYGSQDTLITNNDNGHGNFQPEIDINLPYTGDYYLRVAYSNNDPLRWTPSRASRGVLRSDETGEYRLVLWSPQTPTDPYEPNDSLDAATPIAIYDTLEAEIDPVGDVDWYQFYGFAGASVLMYTELIDSSGLDPEFYLYYGSQDTLIASDDDSHGDYQPQIDLNLPYTGDYYLRIAYYSNDPLRTPQRVEMKGGLRSETGAYRLVLQPGAPTSFTAMLGFFMEGVSKGDAEWGDFNNDDLLDLILVGENTDMVKIARVYENTGDGFTEFYTNLTGVSDGDVAWGDYDNDGDLDIALCGSDSDANLITKIYQNTGSDFVDIGASLDGLNYSSVAWGDYDNDGDLDLVTMGRNNVGIRKCFTYQNDGGQFTQDSSLLGLERGDAEWGDYDNDGDLDLLLVGQRSSFSRVTYTYENTDGQFNLDDSLTGTEQGSITWGDYDLDGDLDFIVTGNPVNGYSFLADIYQNTGIGFTNINAGLIGVNNGEANWGDFDNDGDLDVLLTGLTFSSENITRIYENASGTFIEWDFDLIDLSNSTANWGDYDNDGDLDIVLTGSVEPGDYYSRVYQNETDTPNTTPDEPVSLTHTIDGNQVILSWSVGHDSETPIDGLTYNLRVGKIPDGGEIVSPMANDNGWRKIVGLGGQNHNTSWTLTLPIGTYNWSVQTIDNNFAGSVFSLENTFSIEPESSILYVKEGVLPGGDGYRWLTAFDDLQDALYIARQFPDIIDEIWVAEGTYYPTSDTTRALSFDLPDSVAIYGGFGGFELERDRRDWETYQTILSGDIGILGDESDNSYHVITGYGLSNTAVLDGFTITNGNANVYPDNSGGGMYNESSQLTIRNCVFTQNFADYGGAVSNSYGSNPLIEICEFTNNIAHAGGAMENSDSSPIIRFCQFNGNQALNSGSGGAILNAESNAVIANCAFSFNNSDYIGGAVSNGHSSYVRYINCLFTFNTAGDGGAMYCGDSTFTEIDLCTFSQNHGLWYGGVIYNDGSPDLYIDNSILWENWVGDQFDEDIQIHNSGVDAQAYLNYCCIDGYTPGLRDSVGINYGEGNTGDDPQFVDVDNFDFRLQPDSPVIDHGSNIFVPSDIVDLDDDLDFTESLPIDLDNAPRLLDGNVDDTITVDMGAFEAEPRALFFTPDNIVFSEARVFESQSTTISVLNRGDIEETISSAFFSTANFFVFPHRRRIEPGQTVNFMVTFFPRETGLLQDTLRLSTTAGDYRIPVSGTAQPQVVINQGNYPLWVINDGSLTDGTELACVPDLFGVAGIDSLRYKIRLYRVDNDGVPLEYAGYTWNESRQEWIHTDDADSLQPVYAIEENPQRMIVRFKSNRAQMPDSLVGEGWFLSVNIQLMDSIDWSDNLDIDITVGTPTDPSSPYAMGWMRGTLLDDGGGSGDRLIYVRPQLRRFSYCIVYIRVVGGLRTIELPPLPGPTDCGLWGENCESGIEGGDVEEAPNSDISYIGCGESYFLEAGDTVSVGTWTSIGELKTENQFKIINPDSSETLTITMENQDNDVRELSFQLVCDADWLTVTDIQPTSRTEDFQLDWTVGGDTVSIYLEDSLEVALIETGTGSILEVTVDVAENMPYGMRSNIELTRICASDPNESANLTLNTVMSEVICVSPLPGDVRIMPDSAEVVLTEDNLAVTTFAVVNYGANPVQFVLSANRPWLSHSVDTLSLAIGDTVEFTITLDADTLTYGDHENYLTLDDPNVVTLRIPIRLAVMYYLYDLNGDRAVRTDDIQILIQHLNQSYHPRFDMNEDGQIDFEDIRLIYRHWGEVRTAE